MPTPISRRVALIAGFAMVALALGRPGWESARATRIAAPSRVAKLASAPVTIYDPDPEHLWNRLHRALWVRSGPDGTEYGHDRLDPLLWFETRYLLESPAHEQTIALLDAFLNKSGESLIADPLKRAILQRDLWALFDWSAEPDANTLDAHAGCASEPRRALQVRLAQCIQRLALSPEQIAGLPDNFAAAVASRAFAAASDSAHPDRPFLPPDLFETDGPWVEVQIDNASRVSATRHVFDFGARSAFRVFLHLPEGRASTIAYFDLLRKTPHPWVLFREPNLTRDTIVITPDLPQFPAGTQTALVRQMILIDDKGRLSPTHVTESVQLRVFRTIQGRDERVRTSGTSFAQEFFEFTRGRGRLFANEAGGLRPVAPDDKDFRTQLLVLSVDPFEPPDHVALDRQMSPTLATCIDCHDRPGIYAIRTYTGGDYPRGQFDLPDLEEGRDADTQARLSALEKRKQYSWGLLQGLWEETSRR
jgi:hypothetical protein